MAPNRIIVPAKPEHFTHCYDYVATVLERRLLREMTRREIATTCTDATIEWLEATGRKEKDT